MIEEVTSIDYLNSLSDYRITLNEFNHVLVYKKDNKIVAFLDYSKMYERMEINYIFVINEYRRNNIAFELIKYIIDNNEFENITLEVNINNLNAINLYKKHGFEIVAVREKYYNGVDGYLMERR